MGKEGMVKAPDAPFTEEDVLKHIRSWRWLKIKVGDCNLIQMNWVVTLLASICLLCFIIIGANKDTQDDLIDTFRVKGQPWITQNFTWLYIATQDVWVCFLIWLAFSKYGSLKLGKDNELPKYNDMTWFCMLFCCGIAVGFFFFGVGEPLYYYRQPDYWKSWNYDYNLKKIQVQDDDQRANQSIFMCYFHWGVHGWIPYVLIAINAGIVSHRWGLPMTIRACFYPLIGDHIFSFVGDFIDSISMACTTFGVCTSLGLGAMQLTSGLQYMQREFTSRDILARDSWANKEITADSDTYAGLIVGITTISTISVVSGLNHGLKYLSMLAMVICLTILFFCLIADNTAYLLNIYVQSIGYYFQYVIQAGFDCEAFQMLQFEFENSPDAATAPSNNLLWGSTGSDLRARLADSVGAVGQDPTPLAMTGADCGHQANPCGTGAISSHFFAAETSLLAGSLAAYGLSQASIAAGAAWMAAYPDSTAVPCGSGHSDIATTADSMAASADVNNTLSFTLPSCPTTVYDQTSAWGQCESYSFSCNKFQAYYDSTNKMFMDWWTVFYWGWWVSWGPFVGIFIATISRGRTIRNVVAGAFILPCVFCFLWFAVFGGLAIKMQRIAELALDKKPDWAHGTVDCTTDYDPWDSGKPISEKAIALDTIGYRMLTCQPFVTQIYDVMRPYQEYAPFLWLLLWVGLFFYFITSSDSGSFVDDMLGSSGLSKPPVIQKVYWCCTEGLVAIVLVTSADSVANVLKGLRSVSICSGFPLTIMMCLMCPAVWRAVKREFGEQDIIQSKKFNTQLWDFAEGFMPVGKGPYHGACATYCVKILLGLLVPGWSVFRTLVKIPNHKCAAVVLAVACQGLYVAWFILHLIEIGFRDSHALAWTFFFFVVGILGFTRWTARGHYGVWGSMIEDYWCSLTMWPFVCAQLEMASDNDNDGAPLYFADLDRSLGMSKSTATSSVDVVVKSEA